MITAFIFGGSIVAGTAALWRTFRYDDENPLNKKIDAWPYILRKPITCGVCSTFWIALIYSFGFDLSPEVLIPLSTAPWFASTFSFLAEWMLLGFAAIFQLYIFVFFFDVSHYYAHKAEHAHGDADAAG
jgi:sterol desaturase/sphingolipid hydroxylase (fatty acid hydroxylase superfamily)